MNSFSEEIEYREKASIELSLLNVKDEENSKSQKEEIDNISYCQSLTNILIWSFPGSFGMLF